MNIHLRLANYISRYAPSREKVLAYLGKKGVNNAEILLEEFGYSEEIMLDMWMRTFLNLGKGIQEIRQKLLKKGFLKHDIERKMEEYAGELYNWEIFSDAVSRMMKNMITKGKSKKIVQMELLKKYPYFRDEIKNLLEDFSDEQGLQKEIQKYLKKYDISDKKERHKFYAALMRKGFGYGEIREGLRENE